MKNFFLLIAIFLSLGIYLPALAQARDSDISVLINPESPAPLENVDLSVSSFAVDLDKAQISWRLNGQLVLSRIGVKSFSFRTEEAGTPTTIDISIAVAGLPGLNKRVIIQPGEVDLLWEAVDSYVPPFYRGKALPSSEGEIKVTAIPNIVTPTGIKLTDDAFSYNWKRNFNVDQGLSGYGKKSYSFKNSYLEGVEDISVSVSSVLGNYSAGGKTSITPTNPKIIFYEKDPVLGIKYGEAITGGFTLRKNAMTITALPYFFSAKLDSSDFKYS